MASTNSCFRLVSVRVFFETNGMLIIYINTALSHVRFGEDKGNVIFKQRPSRVCRCLIILFTSLIRLSLEVPFDLCGLFLRISGPTAMFPGLSMALPWLQWLLSEPDKEGLWFETLVSLGPNTQHGRCGGKAGYLWLACTLLSLSYTKTMEFSGTEASDRTRISGGWKRDGDNQWLLLGVVKLGRGSIDESNCLCPSSGF